MCRATCAVVDTKKKRFAMSKPPKSVSIGVPVRVVAPPAALQQRHLQDAVRDLPGALLLLDLSAEHSSQQPVAVHRNLEHRRRQLDEHLSRINVSKDATDSIFFVYVAASRYYLRYLQGLRLQGV